MTTNYFIVTYITEIVVLIYCKATIPWLNQVLLEQLRNNYGVIILIHETYNYLDSYNDYGQRMSYRTQ